VAGFAERNTAVRLVLANGRSILGDAANGRVFRAVATVCVVSVGVLALAVVVLKVLGKG
jgi:hypothetical protein